MSGPVILAVDQGTTNTKALLVGAGGEVLLSRSRANHVDYPQPGWAEQSASDIWEAVAALIAELAAAAPEAQVAALAISNQRETIVLWEAETGRPVAPAVIWQCQRSAERRAAGSASIRSFRRPRSAGCSTPCRMGGRARSAASCAAAPWIPGCSGS